MMHKLLPTYIFSQTNLFVMKTTQILALCFILSIVLHIQSCKENSPSQPSGPAPIRVLRTQVEVRGYLDSIATLVAKSRAWVTTQRIDAMQENGIKVSDLITGLPTQVKLDTTIHEVRLIVLTHHTMDILRGNPANTPFGIMGDPDLSYSNDNSPSFTVPIRMNGAKDSTILLRSAGIDDTIDTPGAIRLTDLTIPVFAVTLERP